MKNKISITLKCEKGIECPFKKGMLDCEGTSDFMPHSLTEKQKQEIEEILKDKPYLLISERNRIFNIKN